MTTAGWGTADTGGTWLHRYNGNTSATNMANADGTQGEVVVTTASGLKVLVSSIGPTNTTDVDLSVKARSSVVPGAYMQLVGRVVDANRFYAAQINLNSNTFILRKNNNNLWTTLDTAATPSPAFAAGTDYRIRFQIQGTTLRAKYWLDGSPEPSAWAVEATDTSANAYLYAEGQVGVVGIMSLSNKTVTFAFDDFSAEPLVSGMSVQGAVGAADELLDGAQRGLSRLIEALRPRWLDGR